MRIGLCTALLVSFFPLPSFSENPPAPSNNATKPSISINDQFRGKINLHGLSNIAELTVRIVKIEQNDADLPEYQIKALAVVKINDSCALYRLTGQYDDNWKQLNLYDIADARSLGAEYELMQCQIAYGGIEALYRIEESRIASRGMRAIIKECQAGNTSGGLVSVR